VKGLTRHSRSTANHPLGTSMSSVFISYSRVDRSTAKALASSLTSSGYKIWWDVELVGTDDFTDAIVNALQNARAVIVIWSKASAKSKFVRDEARLALHLGKLVATKVRDFDPIEIPLGFGGQHTDQVDDHTQVIKALSKLGVLSVGETGLHSPSSVQDEPALHRNQPTSNADRRSPVGESSDLPRVGQGVGEKRLKHAVTAKSLLMSNWRAFGAGLTLQIPRFQRTDRGIYTSFGAITAYAVVSVGLWFGSDALLKYWKPEETWSKGYDPEWFSLMTIWTLALAALAWRHLTAWFNQRNFVAGALFSLPAGVFTFLFVSVGYIAFTRESAPDKLVFSMFALVPAALGGWILYLVRRNR
jgi:hypothetical protein